MKCIQNGFKEFETFMKNVIKNPQARAVIQVYTIVTMGGGGGGRERNNLK